MNKTTKTNTDCRTAPSGSRRGRQLGAGAGVAELGAGRGDRPRAGETTRSMTFEERDIISTILRFHGADDPALVERLGTFVEWVHDTERAKSDPTVHPAFPLVLLSLIGIDGKDALAAPHRRPECELP